MSDENVALTSLEAGVVPGQPSKGGLPPPQLVSADELAAEPAEPRSSIETLCSLDISDNIPQIVFPMDAEDSPWGGR